MTLSNSLDFTAQHASKAYMSLFKLSKAFSIYADNYSLPMIRALDTSIFTLWIQFFFFNHINFTSWHFEHVSSRKNLRFVIGQPSFIIVDTLKHCYRDSSWYFSMNKQKKGEKKVRAILASLVTNFYFVRKSRQSKWAQFTTLTYVSASFQCSLTNLKTVRGFLKGVNWSRFSKILSVMTNEKQTLLSIVREMKWKRKYRT